MSGFEAPALHLPDRLFHGTTSPRLDAILRDGLRPDLAKESRLSDAAVYLAADPALATWVARGRSSRHGGTPVVLSVAADDLDRSRLRLDANLSPSRYWSRSLAYHGTLAPAVLMIEPWPELALLAPPVVDLDDPEPGDPDLAIDLAWDRARDHLDARTAPRGPGRPCG